MASKQKPVIEDAELVTAEKPATTTTNLPSTASASDIMAELLSDMTPEERAEMLAVTGQVSNLRGERVPVIKTNYQDTPDKDGKTIKKGNFVFDQGSSTVEVEIINEDGEKEMEERVENLGVDLGKSATLTMLGYRQQYSFYSEDQKKRCSSQVFGMGETPVGNNLKHACKDKTCPRRAEGLAKEEKCICQYIVPCVLSLNDEKVPARMYIKGSNYFPFNDMLKAAGNLPLFVAPVKMKSKVEKKGQVTYYPLTFDLDLANAYGKEERTYYMNLAKSAFASIEDGKAALAQKSASKQLVDKSAGSGAKCINDPIMDEDDDIVFN